MLLPNRQAQELLPALAGLRPTGDPVLRALDVDRPAKVGMLLFCLLVVLEQGATIRIVKSRHSITFQLAASLAFFSALRVLESS